MLRKLLKYDLMSVWRSGWGTLPVMIGCAVAATVCAGIMESLPAGTAMFSSVGSICLLVMLLSLFGAMGCIVTVEILVFLRFYKNQFTDEGYLTFTLPVKRSTVLLSKTLNAAIWTVSYTLLFVILLLVFLNVGFKFDVFNEIFKFLEEGWRAIGAWLVVYIFEIILLLLAQLFLSISSLNFAISTGAALAKKAKVISTVGIYYLVGLVTSFILPTSGLFITSGSFYEINDKVSGLELSARLPVVMLIQLMLILMYFAVGLVLYFMTLDRISRKLNIE